MIGGTGGLISLYYQQQDGSLGVPVNCSAYGATSGIVTGDFNSDGLKDFAASTASYGGLFVFNQDPTGGYGLADYYILSGATSGSSITRLDYNSDSKDDIALIVPHRLCYLTQNAEGKLDTPAYLPSPWAYGLAAGDVTGDGLDDLVYTVDDYQPYSLIGVYAQDAAGVPALLDTYPVMDKPKSLALADVDGDQRTDVITVYEGLESLIVNNQNPEGKLGLGQSYQIPYSDTYQPKALAVGDINSDGFSDIALASGMNGLVVLRHTGNGDDTPPVVTLQPSVTVIWPPTGETVNIPVNVGGSDEGSGLANLHLKVVDEYGLVQPEMDVTPGQIAVPLVAFRNDGDMDGRVYTLILTGIDNAGNTASVQSTVTVPHSNPKNDKPDKPKPPKKNKP
jgi:hypothetical protein